MDEENVSLEQALANAVLDKVEQLSQYEPGSKEATALSKDIAMLYAELTKASEAGLKLAEVNAKYDLEERKFKDEMQLKKEQFELEKQKFEAEKARVEADKKDKIVDWAFKAAGIVVTVGSLTAQLVFTGGWLKKGFKFEETGSFTSGTFRTVWSKIPDLFKRKDV